MAWTEGRVPVFARIPTAWRNLISPSFDESNFETIYGNLQKEVAQDHTIYPEPDNVFRALVLCPPEKTKVVILGQDPYPSPGMADGLAFSVKSDGETRRPYSLSRILKQVTPGDTEYQRNRDLWDLSRWASQGVLLLNTTLTVRDSFPFSHSRIGWQKLTKAILRSVAVSNDHVVFMLWGQRAHQYFDEAVTTSDNHFVLKTAHPRSQSKKPRPFASRQFLECNSYLRTHGKTEIDWSGLYRHDQRPQPVRMKQGCRNVVVAAKTTRLIDMVRGICAELDFGFWLCEDLSPDGVACDLAAVGHFLRVVDTEIYQAGYQTISDWKREGYIGNALLVVYGEALDGVDARSLNSRELGPATIREIIRHAESEFSC